MTDPSYFRWQKVAWLAIVGIALVTGVLSLCSRPSDPRVFFGALVLVSLILVGELALSPGTRKAWVRSVLIVIVFAVLCWSSGVLVGSWSYYGARASVWRGEYATSIEQLDSSMNAYRIPGISAHSPGVGAIRVTCTGILVTGEANLWMGLGRSREYLGDLEAAREAYQMAVILAPQAGWNPSKLVAARELLDSAERRLAGAERSP